MQWFRSVFRAGKTRHALGNSFRHLPVRPTSSISRVAFAVAQSRWESRASRSGSCDLILTCRAPPAYGKSLPYHSLYTIHTCSSFTCCLRVPAKRASEICPIRSDLPHSGGARQVGGRGRKLQLLQAKCAHGREQAATRLMQMSNAMLVCMIASCPYNYRQCKQVG